MIRAGIDQVWHLLRDFHDLSWGGDTIVSVEQSGNRASHQSGAKRILNGVFHETLVELNDAEHYLVYSIDDGPPPVSKEAVSNYLARVRAASVTNSGDTFVEWSSSFVTDDDPAVSAFCSPIYGTLLQSLKETCEAAEQTKSSVS